MTAKFGEDHPREVQELWAALCSCWPNNLQVIPSHHCKKKLTSIINRFFPQVDFKCIFVNRNTIGSFFPFKDQISLMVSSKIIYKYLCGQCNSSYVGETRRHFISRICEHKGISPRTNVPFANPPLAILENPH